MQNIEIFSLFRDPFFFLKKTSRKHHCIYDNFSLSLHKNGRETSFEKYS